MKKFHNNMISFIVLIGFFSFFVRQSSCISEHPIIVIIAFDGFRYDYINKGFTPVLEELAKNGTSAEYMYNVFPTVTLPNFFSIATGLYPETHGVVGNVAFNENFDCLNEPNTTAHQLFHYNDKIVPLWILNEMEGQSRYSGTVMWPGSQFSYVNKQPTFLEHTQDLEFSRRVDTVMEWLLHDKTPANLVFLYFNEPDWTGHLHGVDSTELQEKLQIVNNITEYFLLKLSEHGLRDRVNLIFLSDHGMVNLPSGNIIPNFNDFVSNEMYTACGESPTWQIKFKPGFENEVYEKFMKFANETKGFTIYRREEIPEKWHYKNCKRNADLLLVADKSYGFSDAIIYHGDHGYDNDEKEMRPFFFANGPMFKSNFVSNPFTNIDIYPLVMQMLQLNLSSEFVKPNGTLAVIKNILKSQQ